MPEALPLAAGVAAALLAPVVLLLFVAIRRRKRLSYPHGLLAASDGRRSAAPLFRSLRLYVDAAFDASCALLIGLFLAGLPEPRPWRGPAVVVDASLSMLAGLRGDRPLDEAARVLLSDREAPSQGEPAAGTDRRGARLFLAGRDPATGEGVLTDLGRALEETGSPQELALRLEGAMDFFDCDYALVASLAAKGYGPVTLLSDDASLTGRGVEVVRLATKPPRYLYPASLGWDDAAGRPAVRLASGGGAAIEALWRVGPDGSLRRAKPEEYELRPSPSGIELSLAEPGSWAVQWDGRILPFEAPGRPAPLGASGDFPSLVLSGLGPLTERGRGPRGTGSSGDGLELRDAGRSGAIGYISVAYSASEPCALPPRATFGAVVAGGLGDDKADLYLGEAALASPETALAFWTARASFEATRRARDAGAWRPRPARRAVRVGEGYYVPAASGRPARAVPAPPGEYAPSGRPRLAGVERPSTGTAPVSLAGRLWRALALAALFAAKIAFYGITRRGGVPDSARRSRA